MDTIAALDYPSPPASTAPRPLAPQGGRAAARAAPTGLGAFAMAAAVVVVGVLCVAGELMVAVSRSDTLFTTAAVAADSKRESILAMGQRLAAVDFPNEPSAWCLYAGLLTGAGDLSVGADSAAALRGGGGGGDAVSPLTHVVAYPLSRDEVPAGACLSPLDLASFLQAAPGVSSACFCSLGALADSELYDVAATAAMAVARISFRSKLSPLAVIEAQPDPDRRPDKWHLVTTLAAAGSRFLAIQFADPVVASRAWQRPLMAGSVAAVKLAAWAASMTTPGVPPYDDVPTSLRGDGALRRFYTGDLVAEPFSAVHVTTSASMEPPPRQVTAFRPRSVDDILMPLPRLLMTEWYELNARNLGKMRDGGPGATLENRNELVLHGLTWGPLNAQALDLFGPMAVCMPDEWFVPLQWTRFAVPDGTLVIGQEGFYPAARGVVWDLRGLREGGSIVPVDFQALAESDLDSAFIESIEAAGWWPDGELFSHLKFGAMFKTDTPLDIVLGPHMVSLGASADSFDSVDREMVRLVREHYHQVHFVPPFLPLRAVPQGSTPRKYEPDRRRRTSNHSFPHWTDAIVDALGMRRVVQSLNSLVDLRARRAGAECDCERRRGRWCDACAKWPREVKPRIQDKAHDDAILQQAAAIWGELLFYGVGDFADWFSNTPTAHSERWKSTVAWRADGWPEGWRPQDVGAPPTATFAAVEERRLGFGCAASSCICQRFTDLIMEVARRRFDAEEAVLAARETCPRRLAWLAARRLLGAGQERLYAIHGYTDDVSFSAVGSDRLLRLLRTWDEVCDDFGVKVAIPTKQQVGLSVTWLGVQFFSVGGFMVLPPPKRLRLLALVSEMLAAGGLAFTRYRAMVGMMESARLIVGLPVDAVYGLYGGDFARACDRPSTSTMRAAPGGQRAALLTRWRRSVLASAGSLITSALPSAPPPPASRAAFFLYSDAAGEGECPGLGGYAHGRHWYMALSARALRLPIAVLEFVGVAVNVMVFADSVAGADVAIFSDSLTTVQVMAARARSEMTMFVHRAILALPELQALMTLGTLSINHVYGEGNVMADAVSRGYVRLLRELAAQMGVSLEEVDVPGRAWAFLDSVVDEFERLRGGA